MADDELKRLRAEIDRLTRAVEEANKTAAQRVSDYKQATEALSALQEQAHKGAADLLAERDRYRDEAEGLRELAQHRVVTGIEHDPLNGKLHGCCARCAEQWPCTIERKRNDDALTLAADLGRMRAALDEWRAKAIATNEQLAFAELAATNLEDAARAVLSAAKALQGKRLALDDDDGDEVYIQGPHDDVCWGVTEELNALDTACVTLAAALTPAPPPLADAVRRVVETLPWIVEHWGGCDRETCGSPQIGCDCPTCSRWARMIDALATLAAPAVPEFTKRPGRA